ncbi:MAG: DUF927 domain-containing protein [Pirellulales bacterium]
MSNQPTWNELFEVGVKTQRPVTIRNVDRVIYWNTSQRLLACCELLRPRCKIRYDVGDNQFVDDLPTAILAAIPSPEQHQDYGNWKQSFIEIAALSREVEVDSLITSFRDCLRQRGIEAESAKDLRRQITKTRNEIRKLKPRAEGQTIQAALGKLADGLPPNLQVPNEYRLTEKGGVGLLKGDAQIQTVCITPLVLTKRLKNINSGSQFVEVAWFENGRWTTRVVPRGTIADSRKIVELADFGMDVNSANAKDVVQYFTAFEAVNRTNLPLCELSSQTGWQGKDGERGFLRGTNFEPACGKDEKTQRPLIQFNDHDEGMKQAIAGIKARGKLATWAKAVQRVIKFPKVALALYASLAAALLMILRLANFCIDLAGESSGGKTTTLRISASVWGNVRQSQTDSIVRRCDVTATYFERYAQVNCDLPVYFDETKLLKDNHELGTRIYAFTTGMSRGRGTIGSLQRSTSYRSVLFTTGEQPITANSSDGGTRPRVLTLWGPPFTGDPNEVSQLIHEVMEVVEANYGVLGRKWVQVLVANRKAWKDWRNRHQEICKDYQSKVGQNRFALRQAESWAAIRLAAELVHEHIKLPWGFRDPIQPLLDDLCKEVSTADRALEALRFAYEHFVSHEVSFFNPEFRDRQENMWLGCCRYERPKDSRAAAAGDRHLVEFAFIPARLREVLKDGEFDDDAVLRSWRDRRWIHYDKKQQRNTVKRSIRKDRVNVVAFTPAAIEIVQG